ncbi:unnamed protein product [Sphenostylis stenocarpa]|uniref:BZIP domain-containing protein n=1 Tax=Sphenostylis stenocarpa TaxID=92480 RepID=A0AA86S5E3_9FABA|nr:unnamed protein product [Sphenostylis stenocarpa]
MLSSSSSTTTTTTTTTCTCNKNNLNNKTLSSSPSSLPSHFSHQTQRTNNFSSNKAMEDVWEDINLTSLSNHSPNTTHISKGAKFQDFLARPFNTFTVDPSPVTALTLSTRSEHPLPHKNLQLAQTVSKTDPFAIPFANKSAPASRDMRDARLMKNRESAARSRARKQENIASSSSSSPFVVESAYLFELKLKIKQLQEENARLRRQQQLVRFSSVVWTIPEINQRHDFKDKRAK